jgi:hypothetical protein
VPPTNNFYILPYFTEIDLIPFSVTLGVGVFVSVEMGMIAGTLTHLAILLYTSNTPKINIQKIKVRYLIFVMLHY